MRPYYEDHGITLYHADARDVISTLRGSAIITDPVWPNVPAGTVAGWDDPMGLLAAVLEPSCVERVVLLVSCLSDPRFFGAVPARYRFLRASWLEYAVPSPVGRMLLTAEVAYAFGRRPDRVRAVA